MNPEQQKNQALSDRREYLKLVEEAAKVVILKKNEKSLNEKLVKLDNDLDELLKKVTDAKRDSDNRK